MKINTTIFALALLFMGALIAPQPVSAQVSTGTVSIISNTASSWVVTGPATITGSGTSQSSPLEPSGTYTVTWGAVPGYTTPASQSLTLTAGGTITFSGTYTTVPNCGTVQDASGNIYNTVVIGTQCWMAENLRTTKKPDGTNLTEGSGMYSNPTGSGSPWGKLYDWNTAMNGAPAATAPGAEIQGICPTGWHVPSNYGGSSAAVTEDYWALIHFIAPGVSGGSAGGMMKSTDPAYWASPNTGASNSSGFSAVGAGYYDPTGAFNERGLYAYLLTSAESPATNATNSLFFNLGYNYQMIGVSSFYSKLYGMSLRCVKSSTCTLPWGGSIASGSSVTAYQSPSVTSPATCISQSRTCTSGILSGSYTNQNCTVTQQASASCTTPWGTTVSSGSSVTAYRVIAVKSPTTCASVSENRVCTNGTLSGSYVSQNCKVAPTFKAF